MIQYLCFRRVGKNASRVLPLSIWLLCVGPFVAYGVRMYFATSAATKRSKHQGFGTLIAGFCRAAHQESARMDVCLARLQDGKAADSGAQQHNGGWLWQAGVWSHHVAHAWVVAVWDERKISPRPSGAAFTSEIKIIQHGSDIWWYMMIYDDIWWYMMIYDDIWWYMMIYDDIWWYMMIYDDIWWYMMIYDDIWWYMIYILIYDICDIMCQFLYAIKDYGCMDEFLWRLCGKSRKLAVASWRYSCFSKGRGRPESNTVIFHSEPPSPPAPQAPGAFWSGLGSRWSRAQILPGL